MSEASRAAPVTIHVVAGVLIDVSGRVLLAQRPEGKHLAGLWEFPGGKSEPGETAAQALVRELQEEIGIVVEPGEVLMRFPWTYGSKCLDLETLRVLRWSGEPRSCEGQALRWVEPNGFDDARLTPADRPIMALLRSVAP
ncbi:8-oxo-dGTP diphosphatase MutT [Oleiagrimonas soli]|uniref:8-oxo-dGTP diphosphatase n=1 Tax=Oleiagrimonas soli TaxID=1543381 RepID=A0A841KK76_9GAMM|nr:8-oxo-dGTP diphosphatase MutT [Oleiagrimonas soli]MBB6185552.1 8-oxo-dGTP diphosphatase [Oleiagrimonas soli]